MTTTQRPAATTERLTALLELARGRDDDPDLDYPALVVLLAAEAAASASPAGAARNPSPSIMTPLVNLGRPCAQP